MDWQEFLMLVSEAFRLRGCQVSGRGADLELVKAGQRLLYDEANRR